MLKIDVEAIARVANSGCVLEYAWTPWQELGPVARGARTFYIRAALGELARQVRGAGGSSGYVYGYELEAATQAPDTSALDEARRKLREAEDAQGKAAEAVRAARAQVDAIERG